MYWKDVWRFRNSVEYEYKWAGKYGAKGEKREKKKKATPEQIEKQNQQNREKRVRRLIKANFEEDDLWATVKYKKGTRKPLGEVKKDIRKFLSRLRKAYRIRGSTLKFISRLEIGKRGGIHFHILIPRMEGLPDTDIVVQECWEHGRIQFESIYEYGGYAKLAAYITKLPDVEVEKQLTLFPEEERKEFIKYSSSRNLVRPMPERTVYRRRTVKKLVEEGPKAQQGYWIDPNTVYAGTNRYTGLTYLHYIEYKLPEKKRKGGRGGGT